MFDYKDKSGNVKQLNNYMLAKTLSMFEYSGLPDSIPYRELEKILQTHGYAFITEVEGALYALTGSMGGDLDAYYNPTTITISNPWLKFNKTLNLVEDGVLIRNDDMGVGLLPLYEKAHSMMVENEINMTVFGYNTRTQKLISASDDKTKASAELYLKKAIDGDIAIIGENAIFDGVKVQSANASQSVSITNMTEFQQYLKGSLYNEVGLSANFNMKRERLISSEVDQGEDSLFPFVYNMMKCRIKAVEQINKMFDTQIVVDFGSVWHFKNKELVDDTIIKTDVPQEAITGVKTDEPTNQPTNQPTDESTKQPGETIPVEPVTGPDSTGNSIVDQKAEINSMLEDKSLSDDDREALLEMLAELGDE